MQVVAGLGSRTLRGELVSLTAHMLLVLLILLPICCCSYAAAHMLLTMVHICC